MSSADLRDMFPAHIRRQLYILDIQHHIYLQRMALTLVTSEIKTFHPLQSRATAEWGSPKKLTVFPSIHRKNHSQHKRTALPCCRGVVEKVQSLKQQLSDTQTELASLQQAYNLGEKRLVRASKLISALGDEAGRWGNSADTLATRLQLLIGRSA